MAKKTKKYLYEEVGYEEITLEELDRDVYFLNKNRHLCVTITDPNPQETDRSIWDFKTGKQTSEKNDITVEVVNEVRINYN